MIGCTWKDTSKQICLNLNIKNTQRSGRISCTQSPHHPPPTHAFSLQMITCCFHHRKLLLRAIRCFQISSSLVFLLNFKSVNYCVLPILPCIGFIHNHPKCLWCAAGLQAVLSGCSQTVRGRVQELEPGVRAHLPLASRVPWGDLGNNYLVPQFPHL